MKLAIAGASGFVGKALIARLLENPKFQIRALSRSPYESMHARLENCRCDVFSLLDVENALEGQDEAIYLIHSMSPSSQLSQGNFADYDLILADNFARAAKKNGIKRIIYLGGIVPSDSLDPQSLSSHLRSRLEVEQVFKSYEIKLLALRAGMVMGMEGSSFQMLMRLVKRLPLMICPAWTQKKSSPIYIQDVVESLHFALENTQLEGAFDLAGPQSLSYLEMMKVCADKMHKSRFFLDVPMYTPELSKLWVSLVTGAPKNLVYPLVDSLQHDMRPHAEKLLQVPGWKYTSFELALDEYLRAESTAVVQTPKAYKERIASGHLHTVQSVQRHKLPRGKNAEWASQQYIRWLNANFRGLIRVKTEGEKTRFFVLNTEKVLLELTLSKDRSSENRVLFYITGGLLARETKRGRLEFRVTPDGNNLLTAIHDFKPRLPWYLYKYSQAILHASVMDRFRESLLKE